MSSKNKDIDWAGIEREYRSTTCSIREIATWFGISEGAVRKQAKKGKWERSAQTKSTQPAEGAYQSPSSPVSTEPTKIEEVIGRGRNIADRLLDELGAETLHMGEMEVIIQLNETDPDRINAIKQAVSLPTRAKTLQTIALALKTMGETATDTAKGKKAARQASADAATAPGSKFAPRVAPRLAVDNT